MKVNLRCPYCNKCGFQHLDEVTIHTNTVNSKGQNICSGLKYNIDPHKAEDFIPVRIAGKKYAPKDHNGRFIMYSANGKLSKPNKEGTHYLHYQMFHGLSPILTLQTEEIL